MIASRNLRGIPSDEAICSVETGTDAGWRAMYNNARIPYFPFREIIENSVMARSGPSDASTLISPVDEERNRLTLGLSVRLPS
jgi:hypothetical protein